MQLKTKLCAGGMALATTAAIGLLPAAAGATAAPRASAPAATSVSASQAAALATASSDRTLKATSVIEQTIASVGTFEGKFRPTSFGQRNGNLTVTGVVTGTMTMLDGTEVPVRQKVTAPVRRGSAGAVDASRTAAASTAEAPAAAAAACDILTLVLGPLHLDVLGLNVDLNQVNLLISAVPGAGALLGNLLCAVAGLLDGPNLAALINLLNSLLGL